MDWENGLMSGLGKRQADWEEDRQIAKGGKKSMGIKEGWKDFMGWELEVVVGPGGKGGGGGMGYSYLFFLLVQYSNTLFSWVSSFSRMTVNKNVGACKH